MKFRRWMIFVAATAAIGVAAYAVACQVVGQIKKAEFATRPELENWTLPFLGAEQIAIPIAVAASVLFAATVLVIWGMKRLRATPDL